MPMRITNILLPYDNHNVVEIEINNTNEDWGVGYIELDEILLLLYPISSLTDTHWNLYSRLYGLTKSEILVRDINTLPHGLVNSWIENNIDIFNLIPQGLAKDKTMYISKRLEKFAKKENVRIFLAVQDGRGGKGNMKSDSVGWTDSVIKDGDFVLKINKYDNLDEKIIKEELPLFTPPLYKDYLSVVALTESRHTAFRGIGTIVETFADKSIQEIYSPLGVYVNGTFIDKPKQQGE